jgi:YjbE family integral membrane protein
MTIGVVWLLKIPGLMLVGGLALLWIAYKLTLNDDGGDEHGGSGATTFWGAMKTIVIADAVMGIDNVLGVAGAAHGAFDLVVIGLLISIPIVVFGSTLVLKLVERFPSIMYIGAAVLAFTAGKMIVNEKLLAQFFKGPETSHPVAYWAVCAYWPSSACWPPAGCATGARPPTRKARRPEPPAAINLTVAQPTCEGTIMEKIIVYVDDGAHAHQQLAPMKSTGQGAPIAPTGCWWPARRA